MKRTILLLILGVFCAFNMKAQRADSIRISLLTCASGGEIYSLFGHTAIRYENFTRNIDAVFNYGMFNFNAPNFILRFALGETDYQLGATNYEHFVAEYNYLGRDVWQQTLNLTPDEKEHLFNLLQENYRPENREYRYNFFYDNCATRPRDQIEKAIDGSLQYADNMTDNDTGVSFRDLLHKYSEGHPWSRFGMDMCMGSEADKPINRRLMMFVPFYVQEYFNTAQIIDKEGKARPLVSSEEKIVETGIIDIALRDVKGNVRKLTDLKGKVVLLDFSVFQSPAGSPHNLMLRELYNEYAKQGLEIYQVSLDADEHYWKTAADNLPWVCVRDGNGVYSTNVAVYNVRQVPSIFLINRNNELKLRGEDIKDLEAAVKSLL